MTSGPDELLVGRLALHYKLITQGQLEEVTSLLALAGGRRRLTEILTEMGYLTPRQVEQLLVVQRDYLAKRQAQAQAHAHAQAQAQAKAGAAAHARTPAEERPADQASLGPAIGPGGGAPLPALGATAGATLAPLAPADTTAAPPAGEQPGAPPGEAAAAGALPWRQAARKLDALLEDAVEKGASDIHIHSSAPLAYRMDGRLRTIETGPLDVVTAQQMIEDVLSPAQRQALAEHGQVDFAYDLPGRGRFRANAFRQQRGVDAVFRAIAPEPPTLLQLGLPESLTRLTEYHQGIVLLTGPAGCGKSSTLAALVRILNETRQEHIITVEDPIEFIHHSRGCVVNQREVGHHTRSFARALRASLREDPDIIAIGELRDLDTISLAITAAETGHLVLATLHTNSAIRTINRILGVFPPNLQEQVRTMLAESLRAVVSQRLVARADGAGRVPALEILIATRAVSNLIRENKTFQIRSVLQTGTAHGMVQLDVSLADLVRRQVVTREEALHHAEDPQKIPA
jgi:twitching motility protein PilT